MVTSRAYLVLRKFAELLKTFTRASDISGRMGGYEFLLVLTHVDEKKHSTGQWTASVSSLPLRSSYLAVGLFR